MLANMLVDKHANAFQIVLAALKQQFANTGNAWLSCNSYASCWLQQQGEAA